MTKGRKISVGARKVHVMNAPSSDALAADLYHMGISCSWTVFFIFAAALFIGINLLFGTIYWFLPEGQISNLNKGDWPRAFFFAVETFSTVGYGALHPEGLLAHFIASIQMFCGLVGSALITGMIFARFSAPKPNLMFARTPVICQSEGKKYLMIRVANLRFTPILDAKAKLRIIRDGKGSDGKTSRRVEDMRIVKPDHPLFMLSWTMAHEINKESPLYGETLDSLTSKGSIIALTVSGYDEALSQQAVSKHIYHPSDLTWGMRYSSMGGKNGQGEEFLDFRNFDELEPDFSGSLLADDDGENPV